MNEHSAARTGDPGRDVSLLEVGHHHQGNIAIIVGVVVVTGVQYIIPTLVDVAWLGCAS